MYKSKLRPYLCGLLAAWACGCSAEPAPAPRSPLTLKVKTNAHITKDLDEAWLTIKQDGNEVYHRELKLDPLLPRVDTLPLEVEVIPGSAKAPYIEFLVESRRNGQAVGDWRYGLLLPSDPGKVVDSEVQNERDARAMAEGRGPQATTSQAEDYDAPVEPARARLDIEIDGLCLDPPITCPDTQTCVKGRCVDSDLHFEDLLLLRESDVVPPVQDVAAPCVDIEQCFASFEELVPLDGTCTYMTPSDGGFSLAAQLKGSGVGYCESGVCLLPLTPGQGQDWTESDGVITVDPELCKSGRVEHFVVSRDCDITKSTSFCATHVLTSGEGGAGGAGGVAGQGPVDTGGQAGGDTTPSGPEVLASGREAPWTIAVNAQGVFWLELTHVMRINLDGGTPSELAGGNFVTEPASLAISDATLYYSNSSPGASAAVMSVPLAGGTDPMPFATGQGGQTWGVAASGGYVYWTNLNGRSILRSPEAEPNSTTPEVLYATDAAGRSYDCLVDSQTLYWGEEDGSVYKQQLSASAPTLTLSQVPSGTSAPVVRLALAGGSLFWTTGKPSLPTSPTPGASALYKVLLADGTVTELANGATVTPAVAADETGVYYCDGALKRLPHDGGAEQVIAEGQQAAAIALDQTHVYWTDATAGTVMRAPK